jgi:drug/metabolite transporter (DMT)-like permease
VFAVLLGLVSAGAWGAADFTGGIASRRTGAYLAVLYGEAVGLPAILAISLVMREPLPQFSIWLPAMIGGILGSSGLLLLYHAMTKGLMSIATPVSALLAALIPVIIGSFIEAPAGPPAVLGFVFALAAVWLISQSQAGIQDLLAHLRALQLPLLAGIGFGLYFVLMHISTRHATYWPMVASRTGGVLILTVYVLLSRTSWKANKAAYVLIVLNGLLDIGGNIFFVLAGQAGRLDVSAVLSSLYPGATVLLAWVFLRERLSRTQWAGILAALVAIVLFTL